MAIKTIQQLKDAFGPGDAPRSSDYINLIDTLADDRNAVYISATEPDDVEANPMWFDTTDGSLKIYSNSQWNSISDDIPAGGTTGQVLSKASADDYDTAWRDQYPISASLANDSTPTALPLNATMQRLNYNASAISFTLADGYEGQLMYFTAVPTSGDVYYPWSINIACNGRYINGNTETQGPIAGSWYPWGGYDSTSFSAFAIFSGGAWNFSSGTFLEGP